MNTARPIFAVTPSRSEFEELVNEYGSATWLPTPESVGKVTIPPWHLIVFGHAYLKLRSAERYAFHEAIRASMQRGHARKLYDKVA